MSLVDDENIFYLCEEFGESMERDIVIPLIKQIQKQRNKTDGRIDLYINSLGGYYVVLRQIVDLVEIAKREGIVVRTIVSGIAASAASMLAISGTPGERYVGPYARHIVHYGNAASEDTNMVELERNFRTKDQVYKEVLKHYKEHANIPNLESQIMAADLVVDARQAIRWGMADKPLTRFDIGLEQCN